MSGEKTNLVKEATARGQSFWLDFIDRALVEGDINRAAGGGSELRDLVEHHGVRGLTSNPAIFEKAFASSSAYDPQIRGLLQENKDLSALELFEELAASDIRAACDTLRPVYDAAEGADGLVSFEIAPWYARDPARTLSEARRLWEKIDRPNAMIKVPGTPECIPAIQHLLAEGINVNVTLLFSREIYRQVLSAFMAALEDRVKRGLPIDRVASVASFFVSRVDGAVDARLERLARDAKISGKDLEALIGHAAIDNAKLAYEILNDSLREDRWHQLETQGARPQRLLWASTSVKNARYPDTLYVDSLIGPHTVNTMPLATLRAFEDHGTAQATILEDLSSSRDRLDRLGQHGISMAEITDELLEEGIRLFAEPFDRLTAGLERKRRRSAPPISSFRYFLPNSYLGAVGESLADWRKEGKMRRLWAKDASLWTGKDEGRWLDWLQLPASSAESLEALREIREEVRSRGLKHVLVLGMGGSSLAPEVLGQCLPREEGDPALLVLDSTDPDEVRSVEKEIDPARTLFIVSSKSGSTLEPNLFLDFFWDRAKRSLGLAAAARRFVAVTDIWSALEKTARERQFGHIFLGAPGVGGRFSALSYFGLVPAAARGANVEELLASARAMSLACGPFAPAEENPGALLGVLLGCLAKAGRDKLTFALAPSINSLGAWLEQLIAESTGKQGKGLIPVWGEPLGNPGSYGEDRVFVSFSLAGDAEPAVESALSALEEAGHPVIRIGLTNVYGVAQEFFRWEIATAVAGAVIGINPFDQPDVEASKDETRRLTKAFEESGKLPGEKAFFEDGGIRLFADEKNADELRARLAGRAPSLAAYLGAHLSRAGAGDYVALLAYLEKEPAGEAVLQRLREEIRSRLRVATCLGFGPRFLHSTGQAYKGGPNSGVILQITHDVGEDLSIPGRPYGFGVVEAAQARGDLGVLASRDRRLLRVHLPADREAALARLAQVAGEALSSRARKTGEEAA